MVAAARFVFKYPKLNNVINCFLFGAVGRVDALMQVCTTQLIAVFTIKVIPRIDQLAVHYQSRFIEIFLGNVLIKPSHISLVPQQVGM